MEIRTIITEACTRINLVPRRQAVPGDIVENAFRLLKGIVAKYNYDNLLAWTQKSVIVPKSPIIHIYDETDVIKGDNNLYFDTVAEMNSHIFDLNEIDKLWCIVKEVPNTYYTVQVETANPLTFVTIPHEVQDPYPQRYQEMLAYQDMLHFQVRDVAKINSIYVVSETGQPYKEFYNLDFVNHTDYDRFMNSSRVFTYTQKSEGEWVVEIKPYIYLNNNRLKITYNESIEFDIDSELFVPDNYIELLIVALAHKLALMYPRLDESQMNRLQQEVQVLVDNVRTPKAEDRILLRNNYWDDYGCMTQYDLLTGGYMV
jgi:hypothetical protein